MTLLAVLISGNGTNCQALIKASQNGQLSATIAVVISNNAAAPGLRWARDAGIDTVVIDHRDYDRREYFENAIDLNLNTQSHLNETRLMLQNLSYAKN